MQARLEPTEIAVVPNLTARRLITKIDQPRTSRPLLCATQVWELSACDVAVRLSNEFGDYHAATIMLKR